MHLNSYYLENVKCLTWNETYLKMQYAIYNCILKEELKFHIKSDTFEYVNVIFKKI